VTAPTLAAYGRGWLAAVRHSLRQATYEDYRYRLNKLICPRLGTMRLDEVTVSVVRSWLGELSKVAAPSTTAKAYMMLCRLMVMAAEEGLTPVGHRWRVAGAGRPRYGSRPYIDLDQVHDLARACGIRYEAMVLLAVYGPLRFGEVAALRRQDITPPGSYELVTISAALDDRTGRRVEPKTRSARRTLSMLRFMSNVLARQLRFHAGTSPDSLLFTSPEGERLRRSNFNRRVWQPGVETCGLEGLHFHDLRHAGGTAMAASGAAPMRVLMARLGHASSKATEHYLRLAAGGDEALAARLEEINTERGRA